MWLSKPIYEALPHCCLAVGAAALAAAFALESWYWPEIALSAGAVALVLGLVLLLKRRDYRASRSRKDFEEAR